VYPLPDLATPYAKLAISMAWLIIIDAGLKGRSTAALARKLACPALPSEHALRTRKAAVCAAAETDSDAQACHAVHALKSTLRSGASIIEVAAVPRESPSYRLS